jgi:hypothetical protein
VPASGGRALSIVLLAILAVMWVAFLSPLVAPGRRGRGWRPAGGARRARRPATPRQRRRRAMVRRRRRMLLALAVAVGVSVRAWYLFGGVWLTVAAVAAGLLLAYLGALVTLGWRRHRPAHAAAGGRAVRRRGRPQVELPLWSAPLLEGQASSRPE